MINQKYLLKILPIILLILSIIIFLNWFYINILSNSLLEGLQSIITTEGKAFCQSHTGFDLEKSCNNLTNNNCNLTSCCVWTSNDKCKAGDASGPTFNSDEKGKTKQLDYYYFQNKCYGNGCPK